MAKEKIVKLLLGNSDERLNNVIEKLVRDAFTGDAVLQVTRHSKVPDFTRHGCDEHFDLVILLPHGLKPGYRPTGSPGPVPEAVAAIGAITQAHPSRILAFSPRSEDETILLEAGAEQVMGFPFKCEEVKSVVRRMVTLESPGEELPVAARSMAAGLLRGWRRFAQT
jgi:hypothetical protein